MVVSGADTHAAIWHLFDDARLGLVRSELRTRRSSVTLEIVEAMRLVTAEACPTCRFQTWPPQPFISEFQ